MKIVLVISAVIALTAATPNRITNGENAAVGQFPYQISFQQSYYPNTGFSHICGGTIISPSWVVTAGHCVVGGYYRVKAGITLLVGDVNEAEAQVRNVVFSIVHPEYGQGVGPNDIALLQTDTPFVFNNLIQKLDLPANGVIPSGRVVLSGWGSVSTTRIPDYPDHLQYTDLEVITIEKCAADLEAVQAGFSDSLSAESNVCTGEPGNNVSVCGGDSGGPLAQENVLIGVVSWGISPCGYPGAPSVYTRTSAFIDFINQYVDDL